MADFFNNDNPMDQQQQPTFKIGDDEYTHEQLSELVGLGKIGKELETKWNTKIDRVYPEFTKSRQEAERLQQELNRREQDQTYRSQATPEQLSQDEIKRQALQQASELGLSTKAEVNQIVREALAGYKLLNEVEGVLGQMSADGNPRATTEELLAHMQQTGIKDPKKAYKDLFEEQLDRIKEEKLRSLKPTQLVTERTSSAGGKQPELVKPTKDNLEQLVASALRGS